MKIMLRIMVAFSISLVLLVTACSQQSDISQKKLTIVTLMSHPALDQVIVGIKKELEKEGFKQGKNIMITVKNANGDMNLVPTIVRNIQMSKPDVVVAITTPVAQAFAKHHAMPLVFSAVTDPVGAGIVKSMDVATKDVSGVSDAWPYQDQISLIQTMIPGIKTLGVLYNPGESASQYGIKQIRRIAADKGIALVEMIATKSTEVFNAAQQSITKVDAVYLSSDNTVIQAMPAALKVCLENKKALFVGDSGTVEKGGLATVSVGYTGVGIETGKIVAKFIRGNTMVKPVTAKGDALYLNAATAKKIGLEISSELLKQATEIYQ